MITRIHVNRHAITQNRKHGTRRCVLTAKDYKQNRCGHHVDILDEAGRVVASVVYRPEKPLPCGAVCWIETQLQAVVR